MGFNKGGTLMKYRKKPIIIEAYQTDVELDIETLEGIMHANVGDYIITGVNGEKYPCKPDIFEKTYELVEENNYKSNKELEALNRIKQYTYGDSDEKKLKALDIIKECFDLNGFDEFIPNSKWFESEEKQKLLKEVLVWK